MHRRRHAGDERERPAAPRSGQRRAEPRRGGARVVLDSGDAVDVSRLSRWPTVDALPARLAVIALSTVTLLVHNADRLLPRLRPRSLAARPASAVTC